MTGQSSDSANQESVFGRFRVISFLALFFMLSQASLSAQGLPDVDRIDVEDLTLVILGPDGKRRGILSGKKASKGEDGKVRMEGASLVTKATENEFKIEAKNFIYTPGTSAIEFPEGLTITLPDGGQISVPSGTGTFLLEPDIVLHMESDGKMTMRSGAKDDSTISASVPEPVLDMKFKRDKTRHELESMTLAGNRGGTVVVKLKHMPILDSPVLDKKNPMENTQNKEPVASLTCFGPMLITMTGPNRKTKLSMTRRVSMKLESASENLSVFSTTLVMEGEQTKTKDAATNLSSFTGVSLLASGNVRVEGNRINGISSELQYKEEEPLSDSGKLIRILMLNGQPRLNIEEAARLPDAKRETSSEKPLAVIRLTAQESIVMKTPAGIGAPDEMDLVLTSQGRVQRFINGQEQFQIFGKLVTVHSWNVEKITKTSDSKEISVTQTNYSFAVESSGYAPVVRALPIGKEDDARQLSRATVYGKHAEGSVIDGFGRFQATGKEILVISQLKQALDINIGPTKKTTSERTDSKLIVRADKSVDLEIQLATPESAGKRESKVSHSEILIHAIGNVELDHQPLPRNDSKLLTMSGSDVLLHIADELLKAAHIHGGNARISVGHDLLECESIDILDEDGVQKSNIQGPGSLTFRELATLQELRKMLALLPRQSMSKNNNQSEVMPDAGWIDFEGEIKIESSDMKDNESYLMTMHKPRAFMVYGGFENPRSGRTGFKDLAELTGTEVETLFKSRADLMRVESRKIEKRAANVVTLLGKPRINSELDGFVASAEHSIVISGTELQQGAEVPFTVQLIDNAVLEIKKSSNFLGEYVDEGVFAYDDKWVLSSGGHLAISTRPLDGLWEYSTAEETPPIFAQVRKALAAVRKLESPQDMEASLKLARALLIRATGERNPLLETAPLEIAQPREALREFGRPFFTLHRAQLATLGGERRNKLMSIARGQISAIHARLGSLIDISGQGGVDGSFYSSNKKVPPLLVNMQAFSFTFSGGGDLVGTDIEGPMFVRRKGYTVRGADMEGQFDGQILLKDVKIELPPESKIEIEGVDHITLRQRETRKERVDGDRDRRRTIITRITGKKLKVKVSLVKEVKLE